MIEIYKNQVNEVYLTLKEKLTLQNPCYLFEFINEMSGEKVIFITGGDISLYPSRYNKFLIVEDVAANQDLYSGIINLKQTGFYYYKIYETAITSPQNLSPSAATSILEEGRLEVIDTTNTNSYFDPNWVKQDVVFNG